MLICHKTAQKVRQTGNTSCKIKKTERRGRHEKVIDVALKYGYETPESFSRAYLCGISVRRTNAAGIHRHLPLYLHRIFPSSAYTPCGLEFEAYPSADVQDSNYTCEIWVAVEKKQ